MGAWHEQLAAAEREMGGRRVN
eukprot:COSAG02_NODE_16699_length_1063_cov_0.795643_2_plen_21_part_01